MSPSPPTQGASAGQQMPPLGPMQSLPSQPGAMPGGGAGAVDLAGVMQAMQEFQMAAQKLAQGLPPLSPFIAQVLTQLAQAVPEVIMSAGGMPQAPGGQPQMGGPQGQPQPGMGGGQGAGPVAGAPPQPPMR